VSLKRLATLFVLAASAAVVLVPAASAGNFDEQRMGCAGENPATCATGTVGEPYTLTVRLTLDEDTDCAVVSVDSGSLPLGLGITQQFNETKTAVISGTPTQAGSFSFFLKVDYNAHPGCSKPASDDSFIIPINPEVPRLVLQPEQAEVPTSTVGAPYSLQMRSNLPDAKTWSISAGALPTGVNIDAATGLISGTPTTAGEYSFTVQAVLTPDPLKTPARSDTKALSITVRDPVAIAPTEEPGPSEVGVEYELTLATTGGSGTYTLALAGGTLPRGVTFAPDGTVSGTPRSPGVYRFTVTATDSEARTATYAGSIVVAARLAITRPTSPPARVGRKYKLKLRSTGGVLPKTWRLTKGPLPKGVKFDKKLGLFSGIPTKAGRYLVTAELTDALGVTSTRSFQIIVRPSPIKNKKK
jgi:hypothetical protein